MFGIWPALSRVIYMNLYKLGTLDRRIVLQIENFGRITF